MLDLKTFTKKFAWRLKFWYLAGLVALVLTNVITLEVPQLAKRIVNAISAPTGVTEHDLSSVALEIIGLGILTIMIRGISRVLIFHPGRVVEADSKSYLFARMMRLPQSFYDRFGMGELISRLANDIGQLRAFFAFGVLQVLNLLLLLAFTINKMLSVHVMLTVVCLAPLVLMMIIMRPMMTYMHRISLTNQQATGRLTNRVTEAFVNVHVIQANAAEEVFAERTEGENLEVFRTNMQAVFLRTVLFPLMGTLMNVSQVATLFYGGYEIMHGRLSVGDILAFNVYIAYLGFPLSSMGIIVSLYQRCRASLKRISEIDEAPMEKQESGDAVAPETKKHILSIKDLSFSHPSADKKKAFVLKNIDLDVREGQHIGLFGVIGCGKSTLLNLITRIYDPPTGSIVFNGKDVLCYNPLELRKNIGYAQQTVHLFSETIRTNLSFGMEPLPSQTQIEEAAQAAQMLDEIKGFELGWESPIGERGIRLSGGQKQRLALARIFLRNPKLVLLDDVLAAVDHRTEKQLIAYIKRSKSTLLIASHRVSALKHCDEILVMDGGEIIDRGCYAELALRHAALNDEDEAYEAGREAEKNRNAK